MGDETRFLLASVISKERKWKMKMEDVRKVFKVAKVNGENRKPK